MAKRVVATSGAEVDRVLEQHERGWHLVAVILREAHPGRHSRQILDCWELYFERDER